ncbi:hypothetical protein KUCAC02_036644 [Chaenocephalus aceratus]|nr:hypothetical protein KUCAC02_036644 [Chaenocephalus aceratus]
MSEFSAPGLLSALLLFSLLTLRDVYLWRSAPAPGLSSHSQPESEPRIPAEILSGPNLRFQYCKVFQDYSRSISQVYPDITIQGENYPPSPFNSCVGTLVSYLKLVSLLLILSGQNPFLFLGLDTPRFWIWSQDNKVFSCLMAFFLCNMMETHFLSTGAFEITLNDVPVWSKLESGYVPNIQEIFQILDTHLKRNQEAVFQVFRRL